jgi:hypothetical protein
LLLVQAALSAFGLWVIVYYNNHYAAPLMATVFVLMMQCMRALRRSQFLGRAVGVALTRIIVLFSLLIGPTYFAQAAISQQGVLFDWLHRHTALPLLVSLLALVLLRAGSSLVAPPAARLRARLIASCELLLIVTIVLQLCKAQRNLYADAFPYVDDLNEPFRKPVEAQLAALPGEHLVLVRYSKDHNSGEEYVYNQADIDLAKTVWAREIPAMDLGPLLTYFQNRDVWVYEPDEDDLTVRRYASEAEAPPR